MSRLVVTLDGRLLAYRRGGISRYVGALAAHLPAAAPDLDVRLVVNRPTPDAPLPTLRVATPPHHRLERTSLGLELCLRRPALIHSTDFIAPRAWRISRVATIHDLAFLDDPALLTADSLRYYGQLAASLRDCARIIAVSRTTAARLEQALSVDPARVTVIYHGVDSNLFDPADRGSSEDLARRLGPDAARHLGSGRPIILAVGTLEPRKRYHLLVSAVEALAADCRDLSPLLVVVGQPGWQSEADAAALERRVAAGDALWLRDVADDGLRALYQTATVLAVPSRDEGFGLPALEAMAAGLPVVVADRGTLPEVVGQAGITVSDDDPAAWASALERVLRDASLRATLAEQGHARAATFTWAETAARTAAVYREVLLA